MRRTLLLSTMATLFVGSSNKTLYRKHRPNQNGMVLVVNGMQEFHADASSVYSCQPYGPMGPKLQCRQQTPEVLPT